MVFEVPSYKKKQRLAAAFAVARLDAAGLPYISGHRALRQGRVSLPDHIYLLTTVTRRRAPLFRDLELARTASRCMIDAGCWGDATLLCWVLMPDHWHGLVHLGQQEGLSRVMNRMKAGTSRRLPRHPPTGIWAHGFHDRALRKGESVRAVARYIIANPVRAGLVTHSCDYPYWDCVWLPGGPGYPHL